MGWLTDWKYRKPITLSRASGAVTNYQMKLLVGESSGATGEAVDCGGKCLSNFNDLRFTTSDGITLLDYWIESISGTTPNQLATIWIEFNSIGTGNTTFYMYYGNSGASSVSNGVNTFLLFDDFERGNNGDTVGGIWTEDTAHCHISTEQSYAGTRSCKLVGNASVNPTMHTEFFSENVEFQVVVYHEGTIDAPYIYYGNTLKYFEVYITDTEDVRYFDGVDKDTTLNMSVNTWQKFIFNNFNFTNGTFDLNVAGSSKTGLTMVSASLGGNFVYFQSLKKGSGVGYNVYIDNVFMRQYLSIEPVWGVWGTEETLIKPQILVCM